MAVINKEKLEEMDGGEPASENGNLQKLANQAFIR